MSAVPSASALAATLRIARRDALRARGRSALVIAMIGLPVLGVSLVSVLVSTYELTPEQQALLAAKINAPTGPGTGPKKKSPGPVRIPATASGCDFRTSKERATGLEPATSSLGSWHSTN